MGVQRKFKIKTKKGLTSIKRGLAVIGTDSDNDFIFMNIKTKSLLDKNTTELQAKIKAEHKLPYREKRPIELNATEKEVFNIRKDEDKQSKLILCYDTENPKFKSIKNELDKMMVVANFVTYFEMDALVEDEDGNEITHWERFDIPKGDWLRLTKWVISEEGLGMSDGDLDKLASEIMRVKNGETTLAEKLIKADIEGTDFLNNRENEISEKMEEIEKTLKEVDIDESTDSED